MARATNTQRKGPRMIKEILRLKAMGLGKVKIAEALGISKNTVKSYCRAHDSACADGAPGPAALSLVATPQPYSAPWSILVDWAAIKRATDEGDPLMHCWEHKIAPVPDLVAVPYVSFWREFKRRYPDVPLDFHKLHPPGVRAEIDFKGDAHGLGYTDLASGEFVVCKMFGSILCFSQFLYIEATRKEKQSDWLNGIAASFRYFGGVPETLGMDNAKALVVRAHRYDPDYNPELYHFCEHHKTAAVAARPREPKDKNLIENALGVFWRYLRPLLRGRKFYSLGELNAFIRSVLDRFNDRVQRKYGVSRRQKLVWEQQKLMELAGTPYVVGEWKSAKLHPDCHVQVGYNFYSAPHQWRGEQLDVRIAGAHVEIFRHLERVAVHARVVGNTRGTYRHKDEHLPPSHLAMKEATPSQIMADAEQIGPMTAVIITNLFTKSRHPLMLLRRAQGMVRLAKRYSNKALEDACGIVVGLGIEMPRLADVEEIITNAKARAHMTRAAEVVRKPNPHLRGQKSWSENIH